MEEREVKGDGDQSQKRFNLWPKNGGYVCKCGANLCSHAQIATHNYVNEFSLVGSGMVGSGWLWIGQGKRMGDCQRNTF